MTQTITMQPYPAYKPSNIDWIGEIPSHWEVTKVKFIAEIFGRIGYRGYTVADIVDEGKGAITISPSNIQSDVFTIENVTCISWEKYYESPEIMIFENDIVLVKTGSTIGKTAIIPRGCPEMTINPQLVVLKNIKIDNKFFYYQTICDYFKHSFEIEQTGSTTPTISQEKINSFPLLSFPLPEQQAIVNYLDQKTTLIDELIAKKTQHIALLQEQRTALINHAVTKGLNDEVEMKDSGIEWIGEIPEHWEILQIKYTAELLRGKFSHRPRNDERLYGGEFPFIQTGDIVACGKYLMNYTQTLNDWGYSVSKEFPVGTLVMTIAGNIGDVAILAIKSCFPDSIIGFYPYKNSTVDFLYYLFNTLKHELLKNSTVSTQMNLNVERVGSIKVPLPPISEQQAIVAYLDEQTALIDKIIAVETQYIASLKEYRQSLISAVVTGKICII